MRRPVHAFDFSIAFRLIVPRASNQSTRISSGKDALLPRASLRDCKLQKLCHVERRRS